MPISDPALVMVGPFPPPMHGMSTTNAAVLEALIALGGKIAVIDSAPSSLDRSLVARLGRLPNVLRGLVRLAGIHVSHDSTIYMSISGGYGQVYEVLFLLLARLRGMRIFVRHCSFAYLDEPNWLARALVKIAGSDAVHVTQSKGMADRMKMLYGAKNVVPISNAVLYPQDQIEVRARKQLRTLGFLSNLSAEKGILEFLDLLAAVAAQGLPLGARIAGQFQDEEIERQVMERLKELHNVEYVGGVYGSQKNEFFASIDALVFPTRYKNETEAKVNHEAMSRGIPVIAYGRGCIPEILGSDCGLVIDPAAPFVPAALAQIEAWVSDPAAFEAASKAAAARFARTYEENEQRWRALLEELIGVDQPTSSSPPVKQL